jgi:RNA polymerase sigma-70 factor (ECF subfamily)
MAAVSVTSSHERELLAAAREGDEGAFVKLTAPHRRSLHLHCYRILGSLDDSDDALQETMLRAWRGLGGFEPRAPMAGWLYRIATNVSLRMAEQRGRHTSAAVDARLQPYPDRLLEELPSAQRGPHAEVEAQEDVGLAFVAAMQLLPPKQRAVLLLRDVIGWSAREVAEHLEDSVPAVNSALQRARERLERERAKGTLARVHAPAGGGAEAAVMRRFQEAWAAVDIEGIVALLAGDALLTMPPDPARFSGAREIAEFFATQPMEGRLDRIPLVAARANGQPALAAYADEAGEGVFRPYGVMVFAIAGDRITGITGFPRQPQLYPELGLPLELAR